VSPKADLTGRTLFGVHEARNRLRSNETELLTRVI
jgi:hypothetical protein